MTIKVKGRQEQNESGYQNLLFQNDLKRQKHRQKNAKLNAKRVFPIPWNMKYAKEELSLTREGANSRMNHHVKQTSYQTQNGAVAGSYVLLIY